MIVTLYITVFAIALLVTRSMCVCESVYVCSLTECNSNEDVQQHSRERESDDDLYICRRFSLNLDLSNENYKEYMR